MSDITVGHRDELHLGPLRGPHGGHAAGLQLRIVGVRPERDDAEWPRLRGRLPRQSRLGREGHAGSAQKEILPFHRTSTGRRRSQPIVVSLMLAAVLSACLGGCIAIASDPKPPPFDVVVYGGTAGGVIAAVAAAREGLSVALVTPDRHLGGMVSGGLGWTDYGKQQVIGGYSREVFERIGRKYGRAIEWHFEPHVAEQVFEDLVKEANVQVFREHRLVEKTGVERTGTTVTELHAGDALFRAKVFIDASYEG